MGNGIVTIPHTQPLQPFRGLRNGSDALGLMGNLACIGDKWKKGASKLGCGFRDCNSTIHSATTQPVWGLRNALGLMEKPACIGDERKQECRAGSKCSILYIYICVCVCVCMYICIYMYIHTHTYLHTHTHTHTHM